MTLYKKIYPFILILTLVVISSFTLSCSIISTAAEDAIKDTEYEYYEYYEEVPVEESAAEEIGAHKTTEETGGEKEPEEIKESPVKFTNAILEKLDEVEEQYSTEFRQYLESLEKN